MGLFDHLVPSDDVETSPSGRIRLTIRPNQSDDLAISANAISGIESGGRYDALGPVTRNGDRAYGKYQVMGANVGPWTKQYYGQELTPDQFAKAPDAQEAVFRGEFGRLSQAYGPEGAARAWFAGEGGMNDPNRRDILGTSVADYGRKFAAANSKTANDATQSDAPNLFERLIPQRSEEREPFILADFPKISNDRPKGPDIGQGTALAEGLLSGASANFRDEIFGASEASGLPHALGGFRAPVGAARLIWEYLNNNPGEATAVYERARDSMRERQQQASEQYPGTYLAGQIGGGFALPVGAAAQGATLPARIGRGAAIGTGYGGLAGFGEGEGLTDSAIRAGTGAGIGFAVGGAAVPIVETAINAGRYATSPFRRSIAGAINPEREASRKVATAIDRDIASDPQARTRLTQAQFEQSAREGEPVMLADLGGTLTRRLADSSASTSAEGRTALDSVINPRFESQAPRAVAWLRQTFHYPNAAAQQEAIEQSARVVNRERYARAFNDPAGHSLWDEGFQQLTAAPIVQDAIRAATRTGANKAAGEGVRPPRNPFTFAPDGTMNPQPGIAPSLQFWDSVKRVLDDRIGTFQRTGEREAARDALTLRNYLVQHLDEMVPTYREARAGAASFFGAENALEAGQNFVNGARRFELPQAQRALARMSDQEKQLFHDGYASRLIEVIEKTPDRRNLVGALAVSPSMRAEMSIGMGRDRAREFEAWLHVEGIKDQVRTAIQGNSKTAERLFNIGLAGGTGIGASGAYNQDPKQLTVAGIMAALAYGGRRINQNVARRVAELLASNDPRLLEQGTKIVTKNEELMSALRRMSDRAAAEGGEQSGSNAPNPAQQNPPTLDFATALGGGPRSNIVPLRQQTKH